MLKHLIKPAHYTKFCSGPNPIPHKKLTAERLAVAIRVAVKDESMRSRAAALGVRIRTEDGVANAVSIFQQIVAGR